MSSIVSWNLQLDVRDGRLEDARALMEEMVPATRQEPGALAYEWFVDEDEGVCHIYERYADSGAVMTHLGGFGERFAERFLNCFTPTALYVYGEATDEVREALAGFGAVHLGTMGGFVR